MPTEGVPTPKPELSEIEKKERHLKRLRLQDSLNFLWFSAIDAEKQMGVNLFDKPLDQLGIPKTGDAQLPELINFAEVIANNDQLWEKMDEKIKLSPLSSMSKENFRNELKKAIEAVRDQLEK